MDGAATGPTLRTVQQLWATFVAVVAIAAMAVPFLAPDPGSTVPAWLAAALALVAGLAALGGTLALDRSLADVPPRHDRAAVAELRTRLVLQAAICEAPALLSVALAFVIGPPWVAAVGAGPGLLGLLAVRPSPARIDRLDAGWRAAGADVSLRRAFTDLTSTGPGAAPTTPETGSTP